MHFDRLKRREFVTLLGGVAAAWPDVARAQHPAMLVIGFFHNASPEAIREFVAEFRRGLAETDYRIALPFARPQLSTTNLKGDRECRAEPRLPCYP